jgi:hypothetical protein
MNVIATARSLLHEGAWVHIFSKGGEFDFGYGIYKGQVLREDADENLPFGAAEARVSQLTEGEREELASAPEQLMCTKLITARIELAGSDKSVYGHLCWWRVAANEALMH